MTRQIPSDLRVGGGYPFLQGVYLPSSRTRTADGFPFNLPFTRNLDVNLDRPVTFFVGENGSGKSTLMEAIADLCGYHVAGGSRQETYAHHEAESKLAKALRPRFRHRPRDGFFFRAETFVNFAALLDERRRDPEFGSNPYQAYGGTSLQTKSHGEAFLNVFQHRVHDGLFLLDEPEAALSPARQLALLALMHERVTHGKTQFIVATHAPILLTYPNAGIISFDGEQLELIDLRATKHYQITRGVLENPEQYWRHLRAASEVPEEE